jgi:hypothetical protein
LLGEHISCDPLAHVAALDNGHLGLTVEGGIEVVTFLRIEEFVENVKAVVRNLIQPDVAGNTFVNIAAALDRVTAYFLIESIEVIVAIRIPQSIQGYGYSRITGRLNVACDSLIRAAAGDGPLPLGLVDRVEVTRHVAVLRPTLCHPLKPAGYRPAR